ncbi:hypothetical protein RF11_10410 [Thelohanellus kitauei]|uniref:Uncharacterized protein n=1 Tax=Thelohanellus kitauei TaxID=669202 RepID=A0A0C2NM94_THEKT|nr:hypothetical protein RF11_10410 [Thelohanellus kitauei]
MTNFTDSILQCILKSRILRMLRKFVMEQWGQSDMCQSILFLKTVRVRPTTSNFNVCGCKLYQNFDLYNRSVKFVHFQDRLLNLVPNYVFKNEKTHHIVYDKLILY